jgi:phosphoglycerate dehydrogenase-like enzyme
MSSSRPTVFLAGNVARLEVLAGRLRDAGCELQIGPRAVPGTRLVFPSDQLGALFGQVDAIVTSAREAYTQEVFAAAPKARVVVSPLLGVDNLDVEAATELGLAVGYGAYPQNFLGVAEAAVACMVTLLKRLRDKEATLREAGWSPSPNGQMVQGRTVGLVGFGRAGSAVAARLQGWEVRLLVADPYADPERIAAAGAELVPLQTLLQESDVVLLHAFLSPETQGLIGEAQLRLMKPTAYLVNLARGGLVDQSALIRALQEEWIAGAALDVFAVEPLEADSPLRTMPTGRLILTPHNAGFSREGEEAGPTTVLENLRRGLLGEPPLYLNNPAVLPAWRARLKRLGPPPCTLAPPV